VVRSRSLAFGFASSLADVYNFADNMNLNNKEKKCLRSVAIAESPVRMYSQKGMK